MLPNVVGIIVAVVTTLFSVATVKLYGLDPSTWPQQIRGGFLYSTPVRLTVSSTPAYPTPVPLARPLTSATPQANVSNKTVVPMFSDYIVLDTSPPTTPVVTLWYIPSALSVSKLVFACWLLLLCVVVSPLERYFPLARYIILQLLQVVFGRPLIPASSSRSWLPSACSTTTAAFKTSLRKAVDRLSDWLKRKEKTAQEEDDGSSLESLWFSLVFVLSATKIELNESNQGRKQLVQENERLQKDLRESNEQGVVDRSTIAAVNSKYDTLQDARDHLEIYVANLEKQNQEKKHKLDEAAAAKTRAEVTAELETKFKGILDTEKAKTKLSTDKVLSLEKDLHNQQTSTEETMRLVGEAHKKEIRTKDDDFKKLNERFETFEKATTENANSMKNQLQAAISELADQSKRHAEQVEDLTTKADDATREHQRLYSRTEKKVFRRNKTFRHLHRLLEAFENALREKTMASDDEIASLKNDLRDCREKLAAALATPSKEFASSSPGKPSDGDSNGGSSDPSDGALSSSPPGKPSDGDSNGGSSNPSDGALSSPPPGKHSDGDSDGGSSDPSDGALLSSTGGNMRDGSSPLVPMDEKSMDQVDIIPEPLSPPEANTPSDRSSPEARMDEKPMDQVEIISNPPSPPEAITPSDRASPEVSMDEKPIDQAEIISNPPSPPEAITPSDRASPKVENPMDQVEIISNPPSPPEAITPSDRASPKVENPMDQVEIISNPPSSPEATTSRAANLLNMDAPTTLSTSTTTVDASITPAGTPLGDDFNTSNPLFSPEGDGGDTEISNGDKVQDIPHGDGSDMMDAEVSNTPVIANKGDGAAIVLNASFTGNPDYHAEQPNGSIPQTEHQAAISGADSGSNTEAAPAASSSFVTPDPAESKIEKSVDDDEELYNFDGDGNYTTTNSPATPNTSNPAVDVSAGADDEDSELSSDPFDEDDEFDGGFNLLDEISKNKGKGRALPPSSQSVIGDEDQATFSAPSSPINGPADGAVSTPAWWPSPSEDLEMPDNEPAVQPYVGPSGNTQPSASSTATKPQDDEDAQMLDEDDEEKMDESDGSPDTSRDPEIDMVDAGMPEDTHAGNPIAPPLIPVAHHHPGTEFDAEMGEAADGHDPAAGGPIFHQATPGPSTVPAIDQEIDMGEGEDWQLGSPSSRGRREAVTVASAHSPSPATPLTSAALHEKELDTGRLTEPKLNGTSPAPASPFAAKSTASNPSPFSPIKPKSKTGTQATPPKPKSFNPALSPFPTQKPAWAQIGPDLSTPPPNFTFSPRSQISSSPSGLGTPSSPYYLPGLSVPCTPLPSSPLAGLNSSPPPGSRPKPTSPAPSAPTKSPSALPSTNLVAGDYDSGSESDEDKPVRAPVKLPARKARAPPNLPPPKPMRYSLGWGNSLSHFDTALPPPGSKLSFPKTSAPADPTPVEEPTASQSKNKRSIEETVSSEPQKAETGSSNDGSGSAPDVEDAGDTPNTPTSLNFTSRSTGAFSSILDFIDYKEETVTLPNGMQRQVRNPKSRHLKNLGL
ncbi:hypothetical protein G7Y79_00030g064790 [Physcia stellaris]|nr:hypothetical protein G7Y79_00030g064790 [Physcia stellaris]